MSSYFSPIAKMQKTGFEIPQELYVHPCSTLRKRLLPGTFPDDVIDPELLYKRGLQLYQSGNIDAAISSLKIASKQGSSKASNTLGHYFEKKDSLKAKKYWSLAMKQGSEAAKDHLVIMDAMDSNGQQWTMMDDNGRQWTMMDDNGQLWTTMDD